MSGRSKAVFTAWLAAQSQAFRDGIETVATDGFTGFTTAAAEQLPAAVAVMDPFYDDVVVMPTWGSSGLMAASGAGLGSA